MRRKMISIILFRKELFTLNNKIFNGSKPFNPDTGIAPYIDPNIKIKLNTLGFYEEYIADETIEIDDKVFDSSTHYSKKEDESVLGLQLFSELPEIKFRKEIGYYKELYAGHVIEKDYRINGSSGGITTWIIAEMMSNNLIDGVIHVGKSDDGVLFSYRISTSLEQVLENSKTKYYPVELSEVLKELRSIEGNFAVVGIPSFISSLRLLTKMDAELNKKLKYFIGLVCGHQKSSNFTDYMGWQLGVKPGMLTDINYRKKLKESKASEYGIEATELIDGKLVSKTKSKVNLKGQDWGKAYFKKYESDFVDDVMNETADITLGDAWLPEYNEDYLGTNIVIVRNPIISSLLKNAKDEGRLALDILSEEKIILSQKSHIVHTQEELSYRLKLSKNEFAPKRREIFTDNNQITFDRKIIQRIRKKISVLSNIYYLESVDYNELDQIESKLKTYNILYRISYKLRYISKVFSKVYRKPSN